jgi:hypothetical protein
MSKFYVQCGPLQIILTADSVEQAALSALDQMLQAHLWIYDDPDLSEQDRRDHMMLEALFHLDPAVRVSERGFDRADAELVGTPETIDHWHRLMVGMRRLFLVAGLSPRSMSDVASSGKPFACPSPRRPR